MKRIIMLAMILVMILVSIGGCCIGRDANSRSERCGEHDSDGGYDRNAPYERVGGHDIRNTILREPPL
jgi:hypothetical protein